MSDNKRQSNEIIEASQPIAEQATQRSHAAKQAHDVAQAASSVADDPSFSNLADAGTTGAEIAGLDPSRASDVESAASSVDNAVSTASAPPKPPSLIADEPSQQAEAPGPVDEPEPQLKSESELEPGSESESQPQSESKPQPEPEPFFNLEDATDGWSLSGLDTPLEPVRYDITVTQGSSMPVQVRHVALTERLNECYELTLDLVTTDLETDSEELIGSNIELFIDRAEGMRALYSLVFEVEDISIQQNSRHIRVVACPALQLLNYEIDSRVFQGMDVKEILTEVLTTSLQPYEREFDVESFLSGSYNKRDYCVQFRETNLQFVQRLCIEEGLAFFFEGDEPNRREKLVFIDNNNDYVSPRLVIDDEIPIIADRFEEADRESIQSLTWKRKRLSNVVETRGYNEKVPSTLDEGTDTLEDAHNPGRRPIYLHGGRRQIVEDVIGDDPAESFTGEGLDQRVPMAKLAVEHLRSQTKVLSGTSNITDLRPGVRFTLGEHHDPNLDGHQFLVTQVHHRGDASEHEPGATTNEPQYTNQFFCIPIEHTYRPEPVERPKMHQAETATVVGPVGEEIYTDPLGRVRVKFHWDRLAKDERSSCWMRVVQPWGGQAWGFMFIPRVGMEVLVQFLDSNPDRPVVVGSLHNGTNTPPYPLPAEKTKSVIKTSSSPGGGGYNELTFEDAAGAEQIIVHAQKDYNETVENNHTTTVHNSQTVSIDVDHSLTIHGKQTIVVDKDQTETVTGNVELKVEGTRTQTITQLETIKLLDAINHAVDKTATYTVTGALTETFKDGRTTTITGTDNLTVNKGNQAITISEGELSADANKKVHLKQKGHSLTLADRIDLHTGSDFKIKSQGTELMSEGGKLSITVDNEISIVCGSASISLLKDGTVNIEGSKSVTTGTPGTSFVAEPKGATISGAKISSTAIGIHEVKGAMVKIN